MAHPAWATARVHAAWLTALAHPAWATARVHAAWLTALAYPSSATDRFTQLRRQLGTRTSVQSLAHAAWEIAWLTPVGRAWVLRRAKPTA